jgi:methionyl-tRNA formyltransferase
MRPNKEKIYGYLLVCQQRFGGYTGKDLADIGKNLGFDIKTIKRNVEKWTKTESLFAELKYIGQHLISITLEDIARLNQYLKENITCTKQDIIKEINDARIKRGDIPIPLSTIYLLIENLTKALTDGAPKELLWLANQGIKVSVFAQ